MKKEDIQASISKIIGMEKKSSKNPKDLIGMEDKDFDKKIKDMLSF